MQPLDAAESSALEGGWYAAAPDVIWGKSGTYAFIPAGALPPLPARSFDASFGWLPPRISGPAGLRYELQSHEEGVADLHARQREANALGLGIPDAAIRLLSTPELYSRLYSITSCFLDVSSGLITPPGRVAGKLIRFLCDSQG